MQYFISSINSESGKQGISVILIVSLFLLLLSPFLTKPARAAALTEASVRLDRMGASEQYNTTTGYKILIVAKPTTTATEARVAITYQDDTSSGFTVNATTTNHATSTTGLPSTYQGETLVAWPTIQSSATSVTDNGNTTTVVYTSGELTVGTLYGFYVVCTATTCVTNPSGAGTVTITIETQTSAPATIDTSDVAVDIVSADADQVSVTATVPATFNFAIADNSLALGTLSTSSISSDSMSSAIDVDTNANNGYIAWIRSEGAAATLASASTGDAISSTDAAPSPVTCSAGSECYVVDASVSGSGTPTGEYDGNGSTSGGVISTTYEQFASHTGPVANDALTLTVRVAISGLNKAASDYTDTWEVVGAGNF